MNSAINQLRDRLPEITRKIVENYDPEKIILFGSLVAGNTHVDSDIDLFIIKHTNETRHRGLAVRKLFPLRDFSLDVIVYTPEEIKQAKNNFFIRNILAHGKILYQRNA